MPFSRPHFVDQFFTSPCSCKQCTALHESLSTTYHELAPRVKELILNRDGIFSKIFKYFPIENGFPNAEELDQMLSVFDNATPNQKALILLYARWSLFTLHTMQQHDDANHKIVNPNQIDAEAACSPSEN